MSINWFLGPERANDAGLRLFCLPYAGGSATVYRPLIQSLAPEIEVRSVQLAGRGWRLREPPETQLERLADQISDAILATGEHPFAVFGHSMGAWLGLEVVRRLEAHGRVPLCLFASGRLAPGLTCTHPPLAGLSDADFVERVQSRYGGIPRIILEERELLALLLPSLRADIALLERYRHLPGDRITAPIHALVGDGDGLVSVEEVLPWSEETSGGFELTTLSGGHFYFQPNADELADVLRQRLLGVASSTQAESRIP